MHPLKPPPLCRFERLQEIHYRLSTHETRCGLIAGSLTGPLVDAEEAERLTCYDCDVRVRLWGTRGAALTKTAQPGAANAGPGPNTVKPTAHGE